MLGTQATQVLASMMLSQYLHATPSYSSRYASIRSTDIYQRTPLSRYSSLPCDQTPINAQLPDHKCTAPTSLINASCLKSAKIRPWLPIPTLTAPLPRQRPELYRAGPSKVHMNPVTLTGWLWRAVFQSGMLFGSVLFILGSEHTSPSGHPISHPQVMMT